QYRQKHTRPPHLPECFTDISYFKDLYKFQLFFSAIMSNTELTTNVRPRELDTFLVRPAPAVVLGTALDKLAGTGLPYSEWTPATILDIPLTVKDFCKPIRVFTSIQSVDQKNSVLMLLPQQHFAGSVQRCSATGFYRFCNWLKSSPGNRAMVEKLLRIKLLRKAPPNATDEDAALLSMARALQNDMNMR
ncbi:hypothetical protein IFM89_012754, partial [Coptis chinensis]